MIPIFKRLINFFVILLLAFSYACQPSGEQEEKSEIEESYKFSLKYEKKIDSLVAEMTLEEKVNMLHATGMFFSGGVPRLGVPEMTYADGPLGIREEIERGSWSPLGWTTDSATYFPAGGGLSASWNRELAYKFGEGIGSEARARDKDILLAPAVNIVRTPVNGRNFEYFSEDPYLNIQMTVPYVQAAQNQDVAVCVKHYAVNNQETNRSFVNVLIDERPLREIYLPVYKAAALEGHAYTYMGAYNKLRGEYLCENGYMLNEILKGEWNFKGLVVSDWGAVHNTVDAARDGLDIEMGTNKPFNEYYFAQPLIDSVKAGIVDEQIIDEKAKRVLRVMYNINKLDSANRKKGQLATKKHSEIAYNIASESIVLLKNDANVLPLNASDVKTIAVIGDNAVRTHAAGGFGAGVKAKYEVTPLEGIKNKVGDDVEVNFVQGYEEQYFEEEGKRKFEWDIDYSPNQELIAEAVEAAKNADVAIIIGGTNREVESESADRKNIRLPFGQEELIKAVKAANPNTVVAIVAGSPLDLEEIVPDSPALLWAWFNGSESGNALADVLYGTVNPSGKLPWTLPKDLEDSPAHATNSFPGEDSVVYYEEGILVGYRWFDTKNIEPLYPFGYGLSYTTFEYTDLSTDKLEYTNGESIKVRVMVKNTGEKAGKEIVQFYVRDPESSVMKATKELKGFDKLMLNPGEQKTVEVEIDVKDLAYFDEEKMDWVVEPGEYEILAGASSRDIKGSVSVMVK